MVTLWSKTNVLSYIVKLYWLLPWINIWQLTSDWFPIRWLYPIAHYGQHTLCNFKASITYTLVHNFNLSFTSGEYPNLLKIAKVIPLFKKGSICSYLNMLRMNFLTFLGECLIPTSKMCQKTPGKLNCSQFQGQIHHTEHWC